MITLPRNSAEAERNLHWAMKQRLQLMEELALDPSAFGASVPDLEEARQRLYLAAEHEDRRAEKAAFLDVMRADLWSWWQVFDARQLLTRLYRKRARPDFSSKEDRPTLEEARELANAVVVNAPDMEWFSFDWEARAVAAVLKDIHLPPFGEGCPAMLRDYVARSGHIPTYFDAVDLIREETRKRNEPMQPLLERRQMQVDCGRLRRPPEIRRQPHRAVRPFLAVRDILAQFLLKLLERLGLPPKGAPVSGYEIVEGALGISYDSVERIWKHRLEKQSFEVVVAKHSKAIAIRNVHYPRRHRRHRRRK